MKNTSKNNLFFSLKTKPRYFSIFVNIKKNISTPTVITLCTLALLPNFSKPTNEQFVCWPHASTFRASLSVTICFSISLMYVILSNHFHYKNSLSKPILQYRLFSFPPIATQNLITIFAFYSVKNL